MLDVLTVVMEKIWKLLFFPSHCLTLISSLKESLHIIPVEIFSCEIIRFVISERQTNDH